MSAVPDGEPSFVPVLVVVGNVNQGKSSVVAALSEDDLIPVASHPGTTRISGEYKVTVGDRELLKIVDTPGFQRPRQALAWLRRRAASAAERPAAVREFVDAHVGDDEFCNEVELLRPILDGAGILYVVDASSRLEPSNEAEMEILRWTGRPAAVLINRVRGRDRTEEWRPTLRQFFHLVREFDAHGAQFEDRIGLLRGFREIGHEWSGAIDESVAVMKLEWAARCERAAEGLTNLMVNALTYVERKPAPEGTEDAPLRSALDEAYREAQRRFEREARDEIENIYRHPNLTRDDPALELLREDLFAETTWRVFGLTQRQLATYGAAWGASIGAGIDLMVGGLSFFAGMVIGAGTGAVAGWFAGRQVAQVWTNSSRLARELFPGNTGRFMAMGPVASPRYAWVLLDRALVHFRAVRDRSHARRDALELDAAVTGIAASLPKELRDTTDKAMRAVLKDAARGTVAPATYKELRQALLDLLGAM